MTAAAGADGVAMLDEAVSRRAGALL